MANVAQIITENILNKMKEAEEQGKTFRWVKPFALGAPDKAYSYNTMEAYRGINRILLDNNEYLTFNMVKALNEKKDAPQYQIRKGARGNIVCYYNTKTVIDEETGEPKLDKDGNEIKKGFLKYYHVYSREDVVQRDNGENLPSKFHFEHFTHEEATEQTRLALDRFNRLFNFYCKKYGIEVQIIKDGTQAYFSHDMKIRVPDIHNFTSVYEYITTLAHEMVHSTGVALGRFNDKTIVDLETANKEYGKEELVAEIGAQILCSELCIPDDSDTPDNAVAYIQGWASYLKDKPNEIISASTKAEKASDLILECVREMELEEQKNIESEEIR